MEVRVLAALALAGCAHSVWSPAERELCHGQLCYIVGKLGPDWRVVHQEGTSIGFFNDAIGGVVQANATCRDDGDAAPLEALTRQLLVGYTDRRLLDSSAVELARREALHTRVAVRLDGVPMTLDLYVLKRNGCVFDLSYAAPPARYPEGRAAFARFVGGFADARSEK